MRNGAFDAVSTKLVIANEFLEFLCNSVGLEGFHVNLVDSIDRQLIADLFFICNAIVILAHRFECLYVLRLDSEGLLAFV